MSIGMFLSEYSIIFGVFTILVVPFFTKLVQDVSFDKEHGFFNGEGLSLEGLEPKNVKTSLILAGGIAFLLNFFLAPLSLIWMSLFFIPTLYFIKNNCPISILFNKGFYKEPIFRSMTDAELEAHHSTMIHRMRYYYFSHRKH
jgi:hypothetical protein